MSTRIVPETAVVGIKRGLHACSVIVGLAAKLVSHACHSMAPPPGAANAAGTPSEMVSKEPGVKPVRAVVVTVLQDKEVITITETLNVAETYSKMGVPPVPMITEPAAATLPLVVTSPLASTVNFVAELYWPRM